MIFIHRCMHFTRRVYAPLTKSDLYGIILPVKCIDGNE